MNRQTVVILIKEGQSPEPWGNLKKACESKGWKYNTLSKLKLPFEHEGYTIYREPFN